MWAESHKIVEMKSIIQCPATHYNILYLYSILKLTAFINTFISFKYMKCWER